MNEPIDKKHEERTCNTSSKSGKTRIDDKINNKEKVLSDVGKGDDKDRNKITNGGMKIW